MRTDELSRALDDGVVGAFADLRECADRVLASDREGDYGAVFTVSAQGDHEVLTELILARRVGRWEEVGSAGGSYGWPHLPWVPPTEGWDGALLLCSDSTQIDAMAGDSDAKLLVVAGFAAGVVDYLRIAHDRQSRMIKVHGRLRPFVAVAVGDGPLVLTPTDGAGDAVGPSWTTEPSVD